MADQRCGTCARGFYRENGMVACGAPVDQDAILRQTGILGGEGVNPIWAERKYNPMRMLGLAAAIHRAQVGARPNLTADAKVAEEPEGSDCENMHPNDGAACKMWQAHPDLAGDDEYWRDFTILGSEYEEQISDSGKRRHRPLRLGAGPREFGEDRGVGDWRPGAAPAREG